MNKNLIEIKKSDITRHYQTAWNIINNITLRQSPEKNEQASSHHETTKYLPRSRRSVLGAPTHIVGKTSQESLVDIITDVNKEDPLQTEIQAHIIRTIRHAVAIAEEIHSIYKKQTRLGKLLEDNATGNLGSASRNEFAELQKSSALIKLWIVSASIKTTLSNYMTDADQYADNTDIKATITLSNPSEAISNTLGQLAIIIRSYADNDNLLVKMVKQYFDLVIEEVLVSRPSCPILSPLTGNVFNIEGDDFVIDGFELPAGASSAPKIEMVRMTPEQIVGNKTAKHQAKHLAKMIALYDFDRQTNPVLEVAGFPLGVMGDGLPGTGKTILFQMITTLISDYAEARKRPFVVTTFTPDNISSYQGKSAQTAKEKLRQALAPENLGLCLFDDVDQITAHRSDDSASAGQKEVTAVLMETLAGASTINRGNGSVFMFSNYPEKVDDALRQRAGMRLLIDGPRSEDDFIDLTKVFLKDKSLLNDGEHEYFSSQQILQEEKDTKLYEQYELPEEKTLLEIYNKITGKYGQLDTIPKIGKYLYAIQQAEPRFTGRAIKNIFDSVKMRCADFDIPDEWMENHDVFINRSWDERISILKEFIQPATPEMVLQEINKYADSEFRYADKSFEEAVSAQCNNIKVNEAAQDLYYERKKDAKQ